MAIRQLHYCRHCGTSLLGAPPAQRVQARAMSQFCRGCGHPLQEHGEATPVPYLVPDLPGPGLFRWATAATLDIVIACVVALIVAAIATQVTIMVTAGAEDVLRGGGIGTIAWTAGALALLGYQPFFWLRHRRSPGRQLLGI